MMSSSESKTHWQLSRKLLKMPLSSSLMPEASMRRVESALWCTMFWKTSLLIRSGRSCLEGRCISMWRTTSKLKAAEGVEKGCSAMKNYLSQSPRSFKQRRWTLSTINVTSEHLEPRPRQTVQQGQSRGSKGKRFARTTGLYEFRKLRPREQPS